MSKGIYEPPGPVSEALASYYVRHIVQREIDRAFTLADTSRGEEPRHEPVVAAGH